MKARLIQVNVRKDALTITPAEIMAHELPVLETIFGQENVTPGDPVLVRDLEPREEYERLTNKYGPEKVEETYGKQSMHQLDRLMEQNAADIPDPVVEPEPLSEAGQNMSADDEAKKAMAKKSKTA